MSNEPLVPQKMKERLTDRERISPDNKAVIDLPTAVFLDDLLTTRQTNYKSEHCEFIRNEVISEIRGIIYSCIKLRQ